MRVLITGAGGQVGRELVERFTAPGHHDVVRPTRAQFDLCNRDSVMGFITMFGPDVVVHAGAFTDVDACEDDPQKALRTNSLGTRHVAAASRVAGARVLYISTDYVFGGDLDRPYDEWDAPGPKSVYGRSKLGGEAELGDGDTIVRTSWVFGRYGSNIVKTILRLLDSGSTMAFVDDQRGSPTCAGDLAEKIYELVAGRLSGTYHVTNQGATTWYGFARDVVEAAGENPERVVPIATSELDPPRKAPRPANSVLENAALHLQGVPLLPDHRDGIQRVVKELLTK